MTSRPAGVGWSVGWSASRQGGRSGATGVARVVANSRMGEVSGCRFDALAAKLLTCANTADCADIHTAGNTTSIFVRTVGTLLEQVSVI